MINFLWKSLGIWNHWFLSLASRVARSMKGTHLFETIYFKKQILIARYWVRNENKQSAEVHKNGMRRSSIRSEQCLYWLMHEKQSRACFFVFPVWSSVKYFHGPAFNLFYLYINWSPEYITILSCTTMKKRNKIRAQLFSFKYFSVSCLLFKELPVDHLNTNIFDCFSLT